MVKWCVFQFILIINYDFKQLKIKKLIEGLLGL